MLESINKRLRKELVTDFIENKNNDVNNLIGKVELLYNKKINESTVAFNHLIEKCTILNPLNIIKKGYTIVYKDENIVYNVNELNHNDKVKIKFTDGAATATINEIIKNEEI